MKKAVLTVIPGYRLAEAYALAASAEKYLEGFDTIVFVLDYLRGEIGAMSHACCGRVSCRAAEELADVDFQDIAFILTEQEFSEYIKAAAVQKLFEEQYDQVVLCDCMSIFCSSPHEMTEALEKEDTAVKMKMQYFDAEDEVPESFLLRGNGTRSQSQLFALSKGKRTSRYINWCVSKFRSLMNNAVTTDIGDPLQHEFIFSWQQYASVFGVEEYELPEEWYITMRVGKSFPESVNHCAFICVANAYIDGKQPAGEQKNPCVREYFQGIERLRKECRIAEHYRFDFFSDGTPLFQWLRSYYFGNYRLRDLCGNAPFGRRALFTDRSVITGDESLLPITAAADCIWRNRPDIQLNFPLSYDYQKAGYIRWFLRAAHEEYNLPEAYTSAVGTSYAAFVKRNRFYLLDGYSQHYGGKMIQKIGKRLGMNKPRKNLRRISRAYPAGVNLCGFIKGEFGLGEATRILARTLDAGNIPFSVVDYRVPGIHLFTNCEWDHKITNAFKYNTNLILINIDGTADFLKTVSQKAVNGRYNIGFLYWELPELPDSVKGALEFFDEIWVASEFGVEAFQKRTSLPVYCLPCCVTVEYDPSLGRQHFGLPEGKFLFMMMYDTRSISERKNPIAAVRAFVGAFGRREDVALIIKVNSLRGLTAENELAVYAKEYPNIILISGTFSKPEVNSLINSCDAFVSLHRSEGFGLGPAEAMYLGKPAILTNWSGNQVYMTDDNCCPVDCRVVEIDCDYGPYKKGNHWAEPSIEQASMYMKKLVEDKDYYMSVAKKGMETIRNQFSPEAVSVIASKRLREIKLC